jgi:dTDP-4-dehydrorhamnose reductase
MLKIAVTGAKGMLGSDFCMYLKEQGIYQIEWDLPEMDVSNVNQTIKQITIAQPNIVVHFAAYTDVDGAENNKSKAYSVNTLGTWAVAIACKELRAKLLYISTDYVFDGKKDSGYVESDIPNPINYYGQTKLLGEKLIKDHLKTHFILRTSWLFGKNGRNFVKTILETAKEKDHIEVVVDQIGSPTYTKDLCVPIYKLINTEHYGIYHLTNAGVCSWFKYACAIIKESGLNTQILPITSDKINRLAKRPACSELKNVKYINIFKEELRPWQEALQDYFLEMKTQIKY